MWRMIRGRVLRHLATFRFRAGLTRSAALPALLFSTFCESLPDTTQAPTRFGSHMFVFTGYSQGNVLADTWCIHCLPCVGLQCLMSVHRMFDIGGNTFRQLSFSSNLTYWPRTPTGACIIDASVVSF